MSLAIEHARTTDELTEFCAFHDRVYASRPVYWPTNVESQMATLQGQVPFSHGRTYHPLVARRDGTVVARACPVVDTHYIGHWNERLGHLTMFEAMPGTREAVRALVDESCRWLADQGMDGARAGFGGGNEFPFVLDDDDSLPPGFSRQNPRYYHALLKDAGFESEKGWVDYKIEVTPELVRRYASEVESAKRNGFQIRPLGELNDSRRVDDFLTTWNESFATHWAMTPWTREELALIIGSLGPSGMFETSVIAYHDDEPVGVVFVVPEGSAGAVAKRELRDDEKLNFLGIGVREGWRGRGVNLGMAGYAYLALIAHGATHLSYTLVVDDNWPSRRTAEKLGGYVWANYMVYRRNFRGRASRTA